MAKSFDELVKRTTTKKTQAKAAQRARELLGELLLSEVRQLTGKSQREVAEILGMKQPSLSKLEKQADMQISTLRKIVNALGGQLEVLAKFPQGTVRLDQFDSPPHQDKAWGVVSQVTIGLTLTAPYCLPPAARSSPLHSSVSRSLASTP